MAAPSSTHSTELLSSGRDHVQEDVDPVGRTVLLHAVSAAGAGPGVTVTVGQDAEPDPAVAPATGVPATGVLAVGETDLSTAEAGGSTGSRRLHGPVRQLPNRP